MHVAIKMCICESGDTRAFIHISSESILFDSFEFWDFRSALLALFNPHTHAARDPHAAEPKNISDH